MRRVSASLEPAIAAAKPSRQCHAAARPPLVPQIVSKNQVEKPTIFRHCVQRVTRGAYVRFSFA